MSKRSYTATEPQLKSATERAVFELLQDGITRSSAAIRSATDLNCTGAINALLREGYIDVVAHTVDGRATSGYRLAKQYRQD